MVLSINLLTKYWVGVPLVSLLEIEEYADLLILVKAVSACVVAVLPVLYVASKISATPYTPEGATVTELVPSPLAL